jgi:surface antigen
MFLFVFQLKTYKQNKEMSLHIGDFVTILNGSQLSCQWLAQHVVNKIAIITGKYQRDNKWYYNTQEYGGHYKEGDLVYHSKSTYVEECSKAVAELFSRAGVAHDWKSTAEKLEAI